MKERRKKKEERKLRVALTQSEGKLAGLEEGLLERGFEVFRAPLIETKPMLKRHVKERAHALLRCPWLLFTSSSAVEAWAALTLPFDRTLIGAVGRKTAATIEKRGGTVHLSAQAQTSEGLAKAFLQCPDAAGPIGLPRGNRALPTLKDALELNGFGTRSLVIYETVAQPWNAQDVDVVVLSSPSAVEVLPKAVGERAKLIALGPSTGAELSAYGWQFEQAKRPDANAIIETLEMWLSYDTPKT